MKHLFKLFTLLFFACLFAVCVSAETDDKIVIVLDPGHGGHDPGCVSGTRYECEYNYDVALFLQEILEENGSFEVHITRERSEYKKYLERVLEAEKVNADMIISLHFNSSDVSYVNGVEVLASVIPKYAPDALCGKICANISEKCGLRNIGTVKTEDTGDANGVYYWDYDLCWDIPMHYGTGQKSDYYSVICWGAKFGIPAIIVEHAYLSNPSDRALADSENGLRLMAAAEAEAIIEYFTGHTHCYEKSVDRPGNCSIEGVQSEKCTVCGHRKNVTHTGKNPSVHGWVTEYIPATCTTDGYIRQVCQISKNLNEKGLDVGETHSYYELYPAFGHNLTVEKEILPAHGVNGYKCEVCITCNRRFETYAEGDDHVYELVSHSKATCTEDGYKNFACTVCGKSYTETVYTTGHDFPPLDENVTCASSESITRYCGRCNESVTETRDVPPHSYVEGERKEPSCTEDGFVISRCSACGGETREVLKASGHSFGDAVTVKEGGYFSFGKSERYCTCGAVESTELPRKEGGLFIIISSVCAVVLAGAAVMLLLVMRKKKAAVGAKATEAVPVDSGNEDDSQIVRTDSADVTTVSGEEEV